MKASRELVEGNGDEIKVDKVELLCLMDIEDSISYMSINVQDNERGLVSPLQARTKSPLKDTPNSRCASYKKLSLDFKVDFINFYLKHGLALACLAKSVDINTASKWIRKYKTGGFAALVDKRALSGIKPNERLDKWVLTKFVKMRAKGLHSRLKTLKVLFDGCRIS